MDSIWRTGVVLKIGDESLALSAAKLSADLKLPMADSLILAAARANEATLWTQDEHFKDHAHVKYIEKKY
jgi:predicted nucleic acid-binding protein